MIQVDIATLILGMVPLWIGIFAGAWALMRVMIFKPLDEISKDIKEIKNVFSKHDERITLLEYKMEQIQKEN